MKHPCMGLQQNKHLVPAMAPLVNAWDNNQLINPNIPNTTETYKLLENHTPVLDGPTAVPSPETVESSPPQKAAKTHKPKRKKAKQPNSVPTGPITSEPTFDYIPQSPLGNQDPIPPFNYNLPSSPFPPYGNEMQFPLPPINNVFPVFSPYVPVPYLFPPNMAPFDLGQPQYLPSSIDSVMVQSPIIDRRVEAIKLQLVYYFSTDNLCKDVYLRSLFDRSNGCIELAQLLRFNRIKSQTSNGARVDLVIDAIRQLNILELVGQSHVRMKKWKDWLV